MIHPYLVGDWRIHTPEDGRGLRNVFVNGKQISGCYYADTMRGIARVADSPLKVHKRNKRIITRTIRGEVVVLPV